MVHRVGFCIAKTFSAPLSLRVVGLDFRVVEDVGEPIRR